MGIRERLMVNFEDKTLEYRGFQLYVVKQFEYKGRTYLYAVDKATVNNKEWDVYFLYKVKDDLFNHITDKETQIELLQKVSGLFMADIVTKNLTEVMKKGDQ